MTMHMFDITDGSPNRLDQLGYIPLIGTVSGTCRIAYGVVKAAFSAIASVFSILATGVPSDKWRSRRKDGLMHIGRGFVELLPIIGGILTKRYDKEMLRHIQFA